MSKYRFISEQQIFQIGSKIFSKKKVQKYLAQATYIIDLWRGGTATHIYWSNIEEYKNIISNNVQLFHSSVEKQKYSIPDHISDSDTIIIIDDLIDTAWTLKNIYYEIRSQSTKCDIVVLCMFIKDIERVMALLIDPLLHIYYEEMVNKETWLVFPWEGGDLKRQRDNQDIINDDDDEYLNRLFQATKGTEFDFEKLKKQRIRLIENEERKKELEEKRKNELKRIIKMKWK